MNHNESHTTNSIAQSHPATLSEPAQRFAHILGVALATIWEREKQTPRYVTTDSTGPCCRNTADDES